MRYYQQVAVPAIPTARSLERPTAATQGDVFLNASTVGRQAKLAEREGNPRSFAKAAQGDAPPSQIQPKKSTKTLQVTLRSASKEPSLSETVHFPDVGTKPEVPPISMRDLPGAYWPPVPDSLSHRYGQASPQRAEFYYVD